MPLSTSSSKNRNIAGIFLTVLILITAMTIAWEGFWRYVGLVPTHQDNNDLWNSQREMAADSSDPEQILLTGSSRVFLGLNSRLIEQTTGRTTIQLAINGSATLPLLEDLANDPQIKGTVICGITPRYYFNFFKNYRQAQARIQYFHNRTIADRLSHHVLFNLEKMFVYPSMEELNLQFELYNTLGWEKEHRNFTLPDNVSRQFFLVDENRFTQMPEIVMASAGVRFNLSRKLLHGVNKDAVISDNDLELIFKRTAMAVKKMKSRGLNVVFVRMPSSGKYLAREKQLWPRERYWDRLVTSSGVTGIHFTDYPELSGFNCPDDSHLSAEDADTFTKSFLKILANRDIL